jgi:hypothetical protein
MKVFYGASIPLDKAPERMGHHRPGIFRESLDRHAIQAENMNASGRHSNEGRYGLGMILKALAENRSEVVLITDAYDVFFCCGTDEILAKFLSFGKPIVFQMESNLWPVGSQFQEQDLRRLPAHPPAPTRYRYICGGGIMGIGSVLEEYYTRVWTSNEFCNQFCMNRDFILHPEAYEGCLDYHCKIFQTLHDPRRPQIMNSLIVSKGNQFDTAAGLDGRIYNTETNELPCLVHGNGGFTGDLETLWRMTCGTTRPSKPI